MNNSLDFQIQKIKGDFAELICKHHFELMGCNVDKVGVEQLSPSFAKLSSTNKAVQSLKKKIQLMPDFLVVHPNETQASFIEVKYRKEVDTNFLCQLSQNLHDQYKNFIDEETPVYFYLLTSNPPFVYVMKANSLKYKEICGGFYTAGEIALDRFPFFRGTDKYQSFNQIYKTIISPTLTILQNNSEGIKL